MPPVGGAEGGRCTAAAGTTAVEGPRPRAAGGGGGGRDPLAVRRGSVCFGDMGMGGGKAQPSSFFSRLISAWFYAKSTFVPRAYVAGHVAPPPHG